MSAFTKVLILFVCLLSALFAASQIVLYGKRENFGEMYREAQTGLKQCQQDKADIQAQLDDLQAGSSAEKAALQARVEGLQSQLTSKENEVQRLSQEVLDQTRAATRLTETVQTLNQTVETKNATIDELNATLAERASTIEENMAKIEDLQGQLSDRNEKIASLENTVLELKTDKQELTRSEKELEAIIGNLVQRGIDVAAVQYPPIDARVVRVDNELGTAVINKGSQDEVKPNATFTVYRGDQYVATLVIQDVDDELALGRAVRVAEGQQLEVGDNATTQIQ